MPAFFLFVDAAFVAGIIRDLATAAGGLPCRRKKLRDGLRGKNEDWHSKTKI
jgi:hypothetical protein